MKPHAHSSALSSNPLLALRAAVGPQGLTPDAGKDALLLEAGDNGFASIMAQQLAQVAGEEQMPLADQLASVSAQAQPQEDTDEQLGAESLQAEPGWPGTYVPTPIPAAVPAAVSSEPLSAQTTVAATVQMDPKALPMPLRAADRSPRTDAPAAPALLTEAPQAPEAMPAPLPMAASSTMPVTTPSAMAVQPPLTETAPRMSPLASDKSPVTLPSSAVAMPADHPTNRVVQAVHAEGQPSLRMVTTSTATPTATPAAVTTASATETPPALAAEASINGPSVPPAKTAMVDDQIAPTAWAPLQGVTTVRLSDATQVEGVAPTVSQPKDEVVAMPRVERPVESTQVLASTAAAVVSSAAVTVPSEVSTPVATAVATPALPQSALASAKAPEAAAPLTLGHLLASQQAVPRTTTSTVDAFTSRSSPRAAALSAAPSREPDAPWGSKVSDLWVSPGAETLQPAAQALLSSATRPTAAERAPVEGSSTYQEQNVPWPGATAMPAALPPTAYRAERHEVASLPQAVGTAAFTDELVGRVNVWVKQSAQEGPMTAELHLNPAEMGPVLIRIEVNGQQAQVNFSAQQADTRQAIESSLSMLSASLEEAGIQLSGSGVSDQGHSPQQAWGFEGRGDGQPRQSSQSFAMASQQAQADVPGSDEPPEADAWRPSAANRSGSTASGLDLYA